jgi:hypothetical protein
VHVISRRQLRHCRHWQSAFASQHKDHRYYEIVEDTIHPEFEYLYFAIWDLGGEIRAIRPFSFLICTSLAEFVLGGVRPYFGRWIDAIRLHWPRFMYMKTIMVGCVAGEAHLDDGNDSTRAASAEIVRHADALGARLIVLKEFRKRYREVLRVLFVAASAGSGPRRTNPVNRGQLHYIGYR